MHSDAPLCHLVVCADSEELLQSAAATATPATASYCYFSYYCSYRVQLRSC